MERRVFQHPVSGHSASGTATVESVQWIGEQALRVIYRDGDLLRLVSEAYRISPAWLFDPYIDHHQHHRAASATDLRRLRGDASAPTDEVSPSRRPGRVQRLGQLSSPVSNIRADDTDLTEQRI